MQLVSKLLRGFYRKISSDPLSFLCLRLTCDGTGMTWQVSDDVLTTAPVGGTAQPLDIELTQYTVLTLASFLAMQPGYQVLYVSNSAADLSATVLLDATGDIDASNGDHLYGYQSLLYVLLNTFAGPLEAAAAQIALLPDEMATTTADGTWLDLLGGYYYVPRLAGEADAQYGPRIVAETLLARGNGVAIAEAITAYTGQQTRIVDVVIYGPTEPLFDGSVHYDGSREYNASAQPVYGLFDATTGFDLLGGTDPGPFLLLIRGMIERLRDAGTQLRALALQGGIITDAFTAPGDGPALLALPVTLTMSDVFTAPIEGTTGTEADTLTTQGGDTLVTQAGDTIVINGTTDAFLVGLLALADTFTAPTEPADIMTVTYSTTYSGSRRYDGSVQFGSGTAVVETMEG
jgi:hypothetical protein